MERLTKIDLNSIYLSDKKDCTICAVMCFVFHIINMMHKAVLYGSSPVLIINVMDRSCLFCFLLIALVCFQCATHHKMT